jgi:hypothetical protein
LIVWVDTANSVSVGDAAGSRAKWWGDFRIPEGSAGRWHVGPLLLSIAHPRNEWRVCRGSSDDPAEMTRQVEVPVDLPPEESRELLTRYAASQGAESIRVLPILADRSVATRPEHPVTVPARGEVAIYVGSPLWLRLQENAVTLLEELPALRSNMAWWGPSTIEGELCYASRTPGRIRAEEMVIYPHRVITQVRIVNRAEASLVLERLNLPVRRLGLFATDEGALWTETVVLQRGQKQDFAELSLTQGPPDVAGIVERVSEPRDSGGTDLFRAFGSLFG